MLIDVDMPDMPDCSPLEHGDVCNGRLVIIQDDERNLSVYCYQCEREWQAGIAQTNNRNVSAIVKHAEFLYRQCIGRIGDVQAAIKEWK